MHLNAPVLHLRKVSLRLIQRSTRLIRRWLTKVIMNLHTAFHPCQESKLLWSSTVDDRCKADSKTICLTWASNDLPRDLTTCTCRRQRGFFIILVHLLPAPSLETIPQKAYQQSKREQHGGHNPPDLPRRVHSDEFDTSSVAYCPLLVR